VVITGLSTITPFGLDTPTFWHNLTHGISAIHSLEGFEEHDLSIEIGGQIPSINLAEVLPGVDLRRSDKSTSIAILAAALALDDAGLDSRADRPIATIIGSGFGPAQSQEDSYSMYTLKGPKKVRPNTIPKTMYNNMASLVSIHHRLTGGNHIVAAACASGAVALGQAFQQIKFGWEKQILAGGVDVYIIPSILGAWINLRVLSKNPEPTKASRPFDRKRDGLVLSEGAAILILEQLESAQLRGARIYAEIIGCGASSDASHIAIPNEWGQARAMSRALADAHIEPKDVSYINAHGTATAINDKTETKAIKIALGTAAKTVSVSSIKSMLGHSMGASGALEAVATSLALKNDLIPPTINYENPDPDCDLDYTPNQAKKKPLNIALSNSFGFGGNNMVLVFKKYEEGS